jgi:putative transposase
MDTVHGILTVMKRLTGVCLQSLHQRFVAWAKPDTTSLLLLTLTDQARSKSELVAENALLRQQLIVLRRQVKRPACTKTDRILLVLLASMVRTWKQALVIVQPETLLRGIARASSFFGNTNPEQLLPHQRSLPRLWL